MTTTPPALYLEKVERRYEQAGAPLEILRGADFGLWAGQSVALIAPSGAGKSTLLHIAGLLERPDAGEVYVAGAPTVGMADDARTALRRDEIGFVYQFHHLLPEFSALENIMLPQMIAGCSRKGARQRASRVARLSWAVGARRPQASGAVGRRATARRHRARGGERPWPSASGRTDRQS